MDKRIFHLKEELRKSFQDQWTIEKMAEFAGLSVPHFQKLFKENMKESPAVYLHNIRLDKARELLESQDKFYQINEIRMMVGIAEESHFSRAFKKKFGSTPTEYSRQHSEKIQAEKQDGK